MNVRAAGGLLSPGTRTMRGGDGEVNAGMSAAKVELTCVIRQCRHIKTGQQLPRL